MHSSLTIVEPASSFDLTTLERVKLELDITDTESDALLEVTITEASAEVATHCNRVFARESVAETFRFRGSEEELVLSRWPVAEIDSVVVDGVTLDESEYEVDGEDGTLLRLCPSGSVVSWHACYSIVVAYTAGYLLPDESGRNLPSDVEAGVVALIRVRWATRTSGTGLRSYEVPGVIRKEFYDTAGTSGTAFPDEAAAKLARHVVPATGAFA